MPKKYGSRAFAGGNGGFCEFFFHIFFSLFCFYNFRLYCFHTITLNACSTVIIFHFTHPKTLCSNTDFNMSQPTVILFISIFCNIWRHTYTKTENIFLEKKNAKRKQKTKERLKISSAQDIGWTIRFGVVHTWGFSNWSATKWKMAQK